MNERDSEIVAATLLQLGHTVSADEKSADLIIVNTCSVRAKAEDKAMGKLGLLIAERRQRPHLIVGVVGCMVQRMQQEVTRRLPGLNFALSPGQIARLPAVLDRVLAGEGPCLEVDAETPEGRPQPHTSGKIAAFVNILYGCNRHCSYCIVPRVRGAEYSRPAAEIIGEVRGLTAAGVREVTLLGQSVMSYGRAGQPVWPPDHVSSMGLTEPLPRLLEALAGLPGLARLRFTSGHPAGCTPQLARAMAALPPVCEHLHLPVQSGADRILKMMRRGYTADDYRRAVQCLRDAVPDIALTTDIIVGFPSETPEEFELTASLMQEIGFDNAFIFKYNPRPGTPAADMADDVSAEEKLRRNHFLLEIQNRSSLAINQKLTGAVVQVLAEGPSRRNADKWSGRTRTNKITVFDVPPGLARGDLLNVQVERVTAQALYGKVETRNLKLETGKTCPVG